MDSKTASKLRKEIEQHINSIKEENTLIRIFNIIDPVRLEMDKTEAAPINGVENLFRKFFRNDYRKLCLIDLKDLLDWHVQKYNAEQAETIIRAFERIKEIHDRTFWEKLIAVFKGS